MLRISFNSMRPELSQDGWQFLLVDWAYVQLDIIVSFTICWQVGSWQKLVLLQSLAFLACWISIFLQCFASQNVKGAHQTNIIMWPIS